MAREEELGKLSPEQLKKLAKTISEAKSLTNQQAEIIEKVLAGEEDIGKLRISYLEQYFDIYSNKLDSIARKHSSLNDAFLILDNKLAENSKKLSSEVDELIGQLKKFGSGSKQPGTSQSKKDKAKEKALSDDKTLSKDATKIIKNIYNVLTKQGVKINEKQHAELKTSFENALSNLAQNIDSLLTSANSKADDNEQHGAAEQQTEAGQQASSSDGGQKPPNGVVDTSTPNLQEILSGALSLLSGTAQGGAESGTSNGEAGSGKKEVDTGALNDKSIADFKKFLDEIAADGINSIVEESKVEAQAQEDSKKRAIALAATQETIEENMRKLRIAAANDEAHQEELQTEIRLERLKEVTSKELEAQNAINSVIAKMTLPETKEMHARESKAESDAEAYKELEKRMAEYKAQLDAESIKNGGGTLSDEDDAANAALTASHFAENKENLLKDIKKEQADKKSLETYRKTDPKAVEILEKKRLDFIAAEELKLKRKNNGKITEEERKKIKALAEEEYKLDAKNLEKIQEEELKADEEAYKNRVQQTDDLIAQNASLSGLSKKDNLASRISNLKGVVDQAPDGQKGTAALAVMIKSLSNIAAQLGATMDEIAVYKGSIDTRLQGSVSNKKRMGSYWDQLTTDMMSVGAVTPFFKQEDFANNIKTLVEQGISFDLKQRAFLMTIQEKIANTFNVADGTLLRLIRIQQEDSTAGRLGMESALNSFLNNMYENTEYLKGVAESVRGSLEEMEALMKGADATEVEFQVQKWMGSLYSVGMSSDAVTSISTALGQIASGQVDALIGGGAGTLLAVAAGEAGLSIADVLAEGLDSENTNKLLQATVNYLAEIAETSKGNNVVQQQIANVFGVKASDLRAVTNLVEPGTTNDIFGKNLTYDNMLKQLNKMASSMAMRTSIGEMMTNIWENGKYTIASSMANNPISYLLFKAADLLEKTTGGISLPFLNVMGFGVDLETTVADLMRLGSMAGGVLGSIGPMVKGLFSSFSGQAMLKTMGIKEGSGLAVTRRGGNGVGLDDDGGSPAQLSESGDVSSNGSGDDIKNSTVQSADDDKKKQMVEAKEEEPANQVDVLNATVLSIYELLKDVATGSQSLRVRIDNYGLTGGSKPSSTNEQGNALVDNGSAGSAGSGSTGGGIAGLSAGAVDLGGWTML